LLALLAHHFLQVSRIRIKSLTLRLLMLYIYDISSLRVKVPTCGHWRDKMILRKGHIENSPRMEDTQCCGSVFGDVWVLELLYCIEF